MFFSYSNNNKNYTKAVSLNDVRSVCIDKDENSKSAIRYAVIIQYTDKEFAAFRHLEKGEAETVYENIIKELNKI